MGSRGTLVKTDYLFVEPSLLLGLARFLNVAGVPDFYNRSRDEAQADAHATYADWAITGQDLCDAMASAGHRAPAAPSR